MKKKHLFFKTLLLPNLSRANSVTNKKCLTSHSSRSGDNINL